jgi:hypothetical protein
MVLVEVKVKWHNPMTGKKRKSSFKIFSLNSKERTIGDYGSSNEKYPKEPFKHTTRLKVF